MTATERKPIKEPRRLGPVARAVVETLSDYGIAGARFYKRRHARVEFELFEGSETLVFNFACTPGKAQRVAKHTARELEKIIVEGIGRAG